MKIQNIRIMKIGIKLVLTVFLALLPIIKTNAFIAEDSIKIDIVNRGYYSLNGRSTHIIELRIINASRSEANFWVLSCNVAKHLEFFSDRYELLLPDCNSNYPILLKLKPEEPVCFNILIFTKDESCNDYAFTLGFTFVSESDYNLQPGINFYDVVNRFKLSKKQVIYYKDFSLQTNSEQPIFYSCPR